MVIYESINKLEIEKSGGMEYTYIKSEKVSDEKERIAEDEFQHFCDNLLNTDKSKYVNTIDYFDTSIGILGNKECPNSLAFSVALLHEILHNLKPSHEMWDKIRYATFLLNLATRNLEFSLLYDVYHQIELETRSKNLSWNAKEVRNSFEEKFVEKFVVKEDLNNLSEDIQNVDNKVDLLTDSIDDLSQAFDNYSRDDPDFCIDNENLHANDNFKLDQDDPEFNEKLEKKPKIKRKYIKRKKEEGELKPRKKKRKVEKYEEEAGGDEKERDENDPGWTQVHIDSKLDNGWFIPTSKVTGKKLKRALRPGVLPCASCDYKAKDNHDFDKHTFTEHEASRLCTQCGYLSTSFRDYTSHNQTHIFTCEICQEKKLGLKGFRKHMKSHETQHINVSVAKPTPKKEYNRVTCDMCGVLLFENNLKQHILTEHTHETHKCDLCDYTANTKLKVQNHRRSHFVKMSKCHECGKNVKDIRKHFLRNCAGKEKQRHYCHLCEKSFSLKEGLDRHIKHIHQKIMNYHCDHCDYKTYAGFNLRLHISKMHTKEEMEKICQYCNQKTNSLEYHIRIYHIEEELRSKVNKEENNQGFETGNIISKQELPS